MAVNICPFCLKNNSISYEASVNYVCTVYCLKTVMTLDSLTNCFSCFFLYKKTYVLHLEAQYCCVLSCVCSALSTVGCSESGGPAADNQLTSLIALVRGANENKCEPLWRANSANGSETTRTWAGPHSRCQVLISCLTCSRVTPRLLISLDFQNLWGQQVWFYVLCL